MPLYEYQCAKCRHRFEKIEKYSDPHPKKCPQCGGRVNRLASAPAIQFKGTGWYVTDYAGKSSGSESAKSQSSDGKETKESKAEKQTPAKESKQDAAPQKKS